MGCYLDLLANWDVFHAQEGKVEDGLPHSNIDDAFELIDTQHTTDHFFAALILLLDVFDGLIRYQLRLNSPTFVACQHPWPLTELSTAGDIRVQKPFVSAP